MVEPPPEPLDSGHHHPHLRPEQNNGLDDGDVKTPQLPNFRTLPPQDMSQTRPDLTDLPNIGYEIWPVVVGCHQEAPQVLK